MKEKNLNCGIYGIFNVHPEGGNKVYIGKSTRIKERWNEHIKALKANRHGKIYRRGKLIRDIDHLQKAFNRYGSEYFEFHILKLCKEKDLNKQEKFFIYDRYNSFNPACGYNNTEGGDGVTMTEEIREKMSNAKKGIIPYKAMEAARKVNIGNKHTLNHKLSPEHIEKTRKANTGKKRTEEQKKAISIRQIGRKLPEEWRRNIGQSRMKYIEYVEEWKALRLQGLSFLEIGRRYNINGGIVRRYLIKFYPDKEVIAIKTKRGKLKHVNSVNEWKRLRKEGFTYEEISEKYNTSKDIIRDYLIKLFPDEDIINIKIQRETRSLEYISLYPEWRELHNKGLSYQKIAEKYNTTSATIRNYLVRYYPIEGSDPIVKKEGELRKYKHLINKWKNLHDNGLSYKAIAGEYNVDKKTVRKYLLRFYPQKEGITNEPV